MSTKLPYPDGVIPLICLDVDGTLVGSSGRVSDAVWSAVDSALARGQHLALSTARGAFAASWDMAVRLDPDGWHVFHAGGAVVHTGTGATVCHPLDDEQVQAADDLASQHRWVIEIYSATDYTVDSDAPLAVDHASLIGVPFERRPRSELHDGDNVVRVQFVVPEAAVPIAAEGAEAIGLTVNSATSPVMPGIAFVSLTVPGVTKATGIATIAGELGIDLSDVMMVGDGHNDLPALEAVGHPVAMANAAAEVKKVALHHVPDVESDGVVEALALATQLG